MEKEFFLTSRSISSIAEFTLSLVILIYFLSLKNKSKNAWIFIVPLVISTFYYIIAFFYYSITNGLTTGLLTIWLDLTFLSQVWFAYKFNGNYFNREIHIALIIAVIIFSLAFYKDASGLLSYPVYLAGHLWNGLVFLRKAAWLNKKSSNTASNNRHFKDNVKEIFKSPNRESRMLRDFAGWSLLLFILWININLLFFLGPGWLYNSFFQVILHPLLYSAIIYPAIVYLNYSGEKTSFQAKLIGIVLCVMLALLGLMPFMLVDPGIDLNAYEKNTLYKFAALIPISTIIMVLILPLFFRYNLLKALGKIMNGVKKVNAGDLTNSVSVEVNDELGSLAKHFNEMTNSLRQYSLEMEKLVLQRTEELSQSLKNLKATQSQLIQSEKMASLGELTAGIAHEIQNPLNFVNNFSEVNTELIEELKNELNEGNREEAISIADDIKKNEEKIIHHGKRADAIVKGMLQHSRGSSGQKELTDINALADEYLRLTYHGLRAKDKTFNAAIPIAIGTDFDKDIEKINIVPQEIGRVLLNLFTNAFYAVMEKKRTLSPHTGGREENASPQNRYEPTVTVATSLNPPAGGGRKVLISVRDNGNGIPQKVLDKIFQPFFTTKPTGQGTGLGLSLSYDIIKSHGGEIKVETREGEGAEFTIYLPVE